VPKEIFFWRSDNKLGTGLLIGSNSKGHDEGFQELDFSEIDKLKDQKPKTRLGFCNESTSEIQVVQAQKKQKLQSAELD
jgi:hypothetical protein